MGQITLRPIHPNAGIRVHYEKQLKILIKKMTQSVDYWIGVWYKADPPTVALAMDAAPVREIMKKIKQLARYWFNKFNEKAPDLASDMAEETLKYTQKSKENDIKDKKLPTIKFKITRPQQDAMASIIEENVSLIKSIPKEYFTDVVSIVTQGFTNGRDLYFIKTQLMEKIGIEERRAAFIARDQSNKATAAFDRIQNLELGIEEAIWRHTGAGRHPRADHVAADGKTYRIKDGCLISGKYILPGELPNCRCISMPIIEF